MMVRSKPTASHSSQHSPPASFRPRFTSLFAVGHVAAITAAPVRHPNTFRMLDLLKMDAEPIEWWPRQNDYHIATQHTHQQRLSTHIRPSSAPLCTNQPHHGPLPKTTRVTVLLNAADRQQYQPGDSDLHTQPRRLSNHTQYAQFQNQQLLQTSPQSTIQENDPYYHRTMQSNQQQQHWNTNPAIRQLPTVEQQSMCYYPTAQEAYSYTEVQPAYNLTDQNTMFPVILVEQEGILCHARVLGRHPTGELVLEYLDSRPHDAMTTYSHGS